MGSQAEHETLGQLEDFLLLLWLLYFCIMNVALIIFYVLQFGLLLKKKQKNNFFSGLEVHLSGTALAYHT